MWIAYFICILLFCVGPSLVNSTISVSSMMEHCLITCCLFLLVFLMWFIKRTDNKYYTYQEIIPKSTVGC